MAAVALSSTHDLAGLRRPTLCLVPGGAGGGAARPSRSAVVRRQRQVLAAAVAVTMCLALWLGFRSMTATSSAAPEASVHLAAAPVVSVAHIVQPGDSLWSIARSLQPDGDVRPLVDRLASGRHGRPLQVGERITL